LRNLQSLRFVDAVARAGSIRKAADTLSITSSALNRRILAIEEDLGADIFERLPSGVRLSAAGEIYIHHIRLQLSDIERVKSQIADLSGIRRGHVSVACSQALLTSFLPQQTAAYRLKHPNVTFSINLRDRAAAEQSLIDMSADLALVFEPVKMSDFQVLLRARQPIHVIMKSTHPLALKQDIQLSDCLQYPVALPNMSYGVRHLLDMALSRTQRSFDIAIESDSFEYLRHHVLNEDLISFQIPVGLPIESATLGLVTREINERDVPAGVLYLGQLRGRTLPVAAAQFANQLIVEMESRFVCNE
jgi:DNA-binding transcriptional LysR family regulator